MYRILSISYDYNLLATRRLMLEEAGYEVISAEGFTEATERCEANFDLIIIGHSIPQKDKRAIVAECRKHGCFAPIVSLLRFGEKPIPEAAFGLDPGNPWELLKAIDQILSTGELSQSA